MSTTNLTADHEDPGDPTVGAELVCARRSARGSG